jgi:hypothetical protein
MRDRERRISAPPRISIDNEEVPATHRPRRPQTGSGRDSIRTGAMDFAGNPDLS